MNIKTLFDKVQSFGEEDMGLHHSLRATSKLSLGILLLISAIFGAFITYVWVEGYYYSLDLQLPEKTTLSITNTAFPIQSTFSFNVTIMNPTFSPSKANITQIAVLTRDGITNVTLAEPTLPSQLSRGESKTYNCDWDWGNYTGQEITIIAFTSDGTGVTSQTRTPFVGLTVTDIGLDRFEMVKTSPFNITIKNSELSATKVNVTEIIVAERVLENATFPFTLNIGSEVTVTGIWNWTEFQGDKLNLVVNTEEGYFAYVTKTVPAPNPVVIINEVLLDPADTTHFNVTVQNNELSTRFISVRSITITMENGTTKEVEQVHPSLEPAYIIEPGNSTNFKCTWNWTDYQNKEVTITINTLQGYTAQSIEITPVLVGSIGGTGIGLLIPIAVSSIGSTKLLPKLAIEKL